MSRCAGGAAWRCGAKCEGHHGPCVEACGTELLNLQPGELELVQLLVLGRHLSGELRKQLGFAVVFAAAHLLVGGNYELALRLRIDLMARESLPERGLRGSSRRVSEPVGVGGGSGAWRGEAP